MKALTLRELESSLATLAARYDVRVPVRLPDGTRIWGRPQEGPLALEGGPVPRRPTEIFFPQHGAVFTVRGGVSQTPPPPEKPLLLLGLTAADLDALAFVDAFFASDPRDDLYFALRDGALIVGISGVCGRDGSFLPIAGKDCDLELISDGEKWLAVPYTGAGKELEARLEGGEVSAAALPEGRGGGETLEMLRRASTLLLEDRVPDSFWQEIADRCIACTGCTLVCPTCTCFGVQDRCWPERTERSRMWDSCQLDGYAREASGHNPLGTEALRTRRRIHHKLAADVRRWGRITCVACGRCETVCPTGVGWLSVAREMVERFGGERAA